MDKEDIDYYEEIPRGVREVLLNLGVIYHFFGGIFVLFKRLIWRNQIEEFNLSMIFSIKINSFLNFLDNNFGVATYNKVITNCVSPLRELQ